MGNSRLSYHWSIATWPLIWTFPILVFSVRLIFRMYPYKIWVLAQFEISTSTVLCYWRENMKINNARWKTLLTGVCSVNLWSLSSSPVCRLFNLVWQLKQCGPLCSSAAFVTGILSNSVEWVKNVEPAAIACKWLRKYDWYLRQI